MVEIYLLGELELRIDGEQVPAPRSRKARLLLAALALRPGRHARDLLAEQLWPGGSVPAARNSLSGQLRHLRPLAIAGVLISTREAVGLPASDAVVIDVREFDSHLEAGDYQAATQLWRGDFLQDLADEWADGYRVLYRRKMARALLEASAGTEGRDAVDAAWQARALVPDEIWVRQELIRRLGATGEALAARSELDAVVQAHAERGVFLPQSLQKLRDSLGDDRLSATGERRPGPPMARPEPESASTPGADVGTENIGVGAERESAADMQEARTEAGDDFERLLDADDRAAEPLFTGLRDLDAITGGLPSCGLTIIAGRPGMGSTLLALTVVATAAIEFGRRCLIFSPEFAEAELTQRLIALRSQVEAAAIAHGRVPSEEWPRIVRATEQLSTAKLFVDDSTDLAVDAVRAKTARLAVREQALPDIVLIDDVHLLSGEATLTRDSLAMTQTLYDLRLLAREARTAIVATAKVVPEVDSRAVNRPLIDDIPGYRKLAARPDLTLLMYRDEYYRPDTDYPGETEVLVAANRRGPVGLARLAYLERGPSLANLEVEPESDGHRNATLNDSQM